MKYSIRAFSLDLTIRYPVGFVLDLVREELNMEIKELIDQGLQEFDLEKIGSIGIKKPTAFYFKEADGEILAAVVFQFFWGALHIKSVWTAKKHRGKGYATRLMEEVFSYAKKHHASFAFIETMSFQAPTFYERLGFVVDLNRSGYSHNLSFIYMTKKLT